MKRILLISCLAFTTAASTSVAQSVVDSIAGPSPWRVRAEWPGGRMDSVWSDTTWVWQGPCPDDVMTFRFDRGGEFAMLEWPCSETRETRGTRETKETRETRGTREAGETGETRVTGEVEGAVEVEVDEAAASATAMPPELLARYLGEEDSLRTATAVPQHRAWVRWPREKEHSLAWALARDGSCFPPVSDRALDDLEAGLDQALFERDRVEAVLAFAQDKCLSPDQTHFLITRVQSEDKRLDLLTQLLPSCSEPAALNVEGIFVLRVMKGRARALVDEWGRD